MGSDRRAATLDTLTSDILAMIDPGAVVRVGVDGVDGAGKTVFADELASRLSARRVAVLRASVDGFHHPAGVRYRRGRHSPDGFFRDSYDYTRLRQLLLDPLGPGGGRQVVRAIHDVRDDRAVEPTVESAADVEVLVFDGIFLHRPELRDCWDYSVFLDVDFDVSIPRGARRGYGHPDPTADVNQRYVDGQRLYLQECQPERHASVVVDNNDLTEACIVRRATARVRE